MFLVIFFQLMFHLLFTKMNVTIQIKDHEILIIITKKIDIAFFFCYEQKKAFKEWPLKSCVHEIIFEMLTVVL